MPNVIVVEGYSFTDENMARQAQTEAEGVRYVKARTDLSKPDQVFNVYHRLLHDRMFQTPVGYAYLKEMQDYLKTRHTQRRHPSDPGCAKPCGQRYQGDYTALSKAAGKRAEQAAHIDCGKFRVCAFDFNYVFNHGYERPDDDFKLRKKNPGSVCAVGAGAYPAGKSDPGRGAGTGAGF